MTYVVLETVLRCDQSTTGQYCDPQIAEWQTQGYLNITQSCSDCWLGAQQLQLSNPLGYDPGLASNFASLTSACNAKKYSYMTPTAYGLNASAATIPATASATVTPPPTCSGSYAVQLTDTCTSVSQELNVSTYSLQLARRTLGRPQTLVLLWPWRTHQLLSLSSWPGIPISTPYAKMVLILLDIKYVSGR